MKRKNLIIGLLAFFFCSIYSGLNAQDYPLSGEFIFVDNPPTPLNLGDVRASIGYPEDAVKENIEGTVVCRVLVDSQGNYVQHLIMSNPTGILQRAVSKKVNQLKFSPAIAEGKAVSYWINIPFKFRLINENTKKLEELAEAMTDSLTGMREDYNLWFRRGLVYIRLNRTKEALTDIEESIRLNPMKNKKKAAKNTYPSLIKSTFAKATILDKEEDFPAAIYQYSEVLRLSNEMNIENAEISQLIPQVHLGRGYLYLEIDSLKLAKDDLIEVSKDTSQYRCTAFQLLADIGIRDSAYEDLSKYYDGLVECEPEEDLLKYSRGYYSSRAGQYEKALKDFEFVLDKIELTQLLQATHNQMAYCYLGLKQYDKALESLDKTLTLNVLNGESYYYKGKVYAAKGMTKKACENFEKSLNYNAQGDYRNEAISQMKELCGGWEEDE